MMRRMGAVLGLVLLLVVSGCSVHIGKTGLSATVGASSVTATSDGGAESQPAKARAKSGPVPEGFVHGWIETMRVAIATVVGIVLPGRAPQAAIVAAEQPACPLESADE